MISTENPISISLAGPVKMARIVNVAQCLGSQLQARWLGLEKSTHSRGSMPLLIGMFALDLRGYHFSTLVQFPLMSSDTADSLVQRFQQSSQIRSSIRLVLETLHLSEEKLLRFEDEFVGELNNDLNSLLKCSRWAQQVAEFAHIVLDGVDETTYVAGSRELVASYRATVKRFVVDVKSATGVLGDQIAHDRLPVSEDDCRSRLADAVTHGSAAKSDIGRYKAAANTLREEADTDYVEAMNDLLVGLRK